MKIQEIREIIKLVDNSSINEFSYEFDGVKVKMKKNSSNLSAAGSIQSPASEAPVQTSAEAAPKQAEPKEAAPTEQAVQTEAVETSSTSDQDLHKIASKREALSKIRFRSF
jgi:acetyl-CoA carboxylase biotin carboxyl carrier protein